MLSPCRFRAIPALFSCRRFGSLHSVHCISCGLAPVSCTVSACMLVRAALRLSVPILRLPALSAVLSLCRLSAPFLRGFPDVSGLVRLAPALLCSDPSGRAFPGFFAVFPLRCGSGCPGSRCPAPYPAGNQPGLAPGELNHPRARRKEKDSKKITLFTLQTL